MKRQPIRALANGALELSGVLNRLEQLTGYAPRRDGKGFKARCPAHDDHTPSLSIRQSDNGTVLLYCHAGCAFEQIRSTLGPPGPLVVPRAKSRAWNVAPAPAVYDTLASALSAGYNSRGKHSRVWTYVDAEGSPVGAVARWDMPNGEKRIRPLARCGGGWQVGAMKRPRPLYRLDDLSRAKPGTRVYVVEGEKCVDVLSGCYELVTTSAGGAEAAALTDWSPLGGMDVVIFPDLDAAGQRYCEHVLAALARLPNRPVRIRVVMLPGLPPGGDVVDFIQPFCTQELAGAAMDPIVEQAPSVKLPAPSEMTGPQDHVSAASSTTNTQIPKPNSPLIRCAADVTSRNVEWLSYGYLPKGKLTMLVGDPGVGKSYLTCDLAAALSTGRPWPTGHSTPAESGQVLFIGCEDDPDDTVVPRLRVCGADLSAIHFLEDVVRVDEEGEHYREQFTLDDPETLRGAIAALPGLVLIIIDPLTAYFGKADANKNADVRAALAPLTLIALQTGVAILAVNHLTKKVEGPAVYRSLGSIGVAAAARSVLSVIHDPNSSDHERVLVPVKSNVAGELSGWRYALVDRGPEQLPELAWRGRASDDTAEEYMRAAAEGRDLVLLHALDWLGQRLTDGPAPTADLITEARHQEISRRTLFRAKDQLGIQGGRRDYLGISQHMWWLPG